MVAVSNSHLEAVAAWPKATLQEGRGGAIRGFCMPKVVCFEPIHHLYSPAHRKQRFPDADWAFLVHTSRNLAAAFEIIHNHGHVVGDVNQGNVVVSRKGIVKLIDCDSFQIRVGGTQYLCEVGVPHFTPPELQGRPFKDVLRSTNHDNFGLALLIFHLLFMGRHPYSGVSSAGSDMPLEESIRRFRFAYSRDSARRGVMPPPNSPTLAILPVELAVYFEKAFTEAGLPGRPSAREWLVQLDVLRAQLRRCAQRHTYFSGLAACPWCDYEQRFGVFYFATVYSRAADGLTFNLAEVWARIVSIQSPGPVPELDLTIFHVRARPLPPELESAKAWYFFRKIAGIVVFIGFTALWPNAWLLGLIIGAFVFFASYDDSGERRSRRVSLDKAKQFYDSNFGSESDLSDMRFVARMKTLSEVRTKYLNLEAAFTKERAALSSREWQLRKYLSQIFIDDHDIPGIGPTRRAVLQSFQIETAADVDWSKVDAVPGFGWGLTKQLVGWRKSLEAQFQYDPSRGIDPSDLAQVNNKYAKLRRDFEMTLLAGADELRKIRAEILTLRAYKETARAAAAKDYAQSRVDYEAL